MLIIGDGYVLSSALDLLLELCVGDFPTLGRTGSVYAGIAGLPSKGMPSSLEIFRVIANSWFFTCCSSSS
jgi:hypothetical protein